jgi:hypothetical protein
MAHEASFDIKRRESSATVAQTARYRVNVHGGCGEMTKRELLVHERLDKLIDGFDKYLNAYDRNPPFMKGGQLSWHRKAIGRRRSLADSSAAAQDPEFLDALYETLKAWGMNQRGAKLIAHADFCNRVSGHATDLGPFDALLIDSIAVADVPLVAERLWSLIALIPVTEAKAKLVSGTKLLHHLLPDLVPPVDRKWTRRFFGWHSPDFYGYNRGGQRKVFEAAFAHFASLGRAVNPTQFVNGEAGWRTGPTKVLDNAITGFCILENLPEPS